MSVSAVILTLTWPPLTRNSRVSGSRASMLYDPFHDSVSMVPTLGCGPRPVDRVRQPAKVLHHPFGHPLGGRVERVPALGGQVLDEGIRILRLPEPCQHG